jgi:methylated-DNA-[protein]-cysteine S-methyltransferase
MTAHGFTLFETPLGPCGIAWRNAAVAGVALPESRAGETRARLLRRFPEASEGRPPPAIRRAIQDILSLLRGHPTDLSAIQLDMTAVPAFHRRVYEFARTIAPGRTLSYGDVAAAVGVPGGARAVGQALQRNPFAIIVPCHRVLAASGKLGGFTAHGGVATKLSMLALEGVRLKQPAKRSALGG